RHPKAAATRTRAPERSRARTVGKRVRDPSARSASSIVEGSRFTWHRSRITRHADLLRLMQIVVDDLENVLDPQAMLARKFANPLGFTRVKVVALRPAIRRKGVHRRFAPGRFLRGDVRGDGSTFFRRERRNGEHRRYRRC